MLKVYHSGDTGDVTGVLHWFYKGVTGVLQRFDMCVT